MALLAVKLPDEELTTYLCDQVARSCDCPSSVQMEIIETVKTRTTSHRNNAPERRTRSVEKFIKLCFGTILSRRTSSEEVRHWS